MKLFKSILVVLALASLAGCIVVPERGTGYYGGHYYSHSYDGYRR